MSASSSSSLANQHPIETTDRWGLPPTIVSVDVSGNYVPCARLTWNPPLVRPGEIGTDRTVLRYLLFRNDTHIATLDGRSTEALDFGVDSGVMYHYSLRAVTAQGVSDPSDDFTFMFLEHALPNPHPPIPVLPPPRDSQESLEDLADLRNDTEIAIHLDDLQRQIDDEWLVDGYPRRIQLLQTPPPTDPIEPVHRPVVPPQNADSSENNSHIDRFNGPIEQRFDDLDEDDYNKAAQRLCVDKYVSAADARNLLQQTLLSDTQIFEHICQIETIPNAQKTFITDVSYLHQLCAKGNIDEIIEYLHYFDNETIKTMLRHPLGSQENTALHTLLAWNYGNKIMEFVEQVILTTVPELKDTPNVYNDTPYGINDLYFNHPVLGYEIAHRVAEEFII